MLPDSVWSQVLHDDGSGLKVRHLHAEIGVLRSMAKRGMINLHYANTPPEAPTDYMVWATIPDTKTLPVVKIYNPVTEAFEPEGRNLWPAALGSGSAATLIITDVSADPDTGILTIKT